MHGVYDVERVRARGVDVHLHRWRLARVLHEDEVEPAGRLGRRVRLAAFEGNGVVAATAMSAGQIVLEMGNLRGNGRRRGPIAMPAIGRGRRVLRVGEHLETLGKRLLRDG